MDNNFLLRARRIKQNNLEFFLGIYTIQQVLSFTKFTERLITGFDENNYPIYNPQIQRKVENSRVEKIADFLLDDPDALFPTNLVIAVPNAAIESLEDIDNNISLTLNKKVFSELQKENGDVFLTIIDGQHRIRGIERAIERIEEEVTNLSKVLQKSSNIELKKKLDNRNRQLFQLNNIELPVTFFIDPTLEFQAMVFSTINRTQKSVPQSLVFSLFGISEGSSPQKTALQIVLALNSFQSSPFYNRIKLYGGKYERNQSPPLTQAGMVKSIIDLISTNLRESERDRFKERKLLLKDSNPDLPFRRYYALDNDNLILDILFSFFTAVKESFTIGDVSAWNFEANTKPNNILQTTVGYQALLLILVEILKIEKEDDKRDKIDTYKLYLQKTNNLDIYNQERYPFTSKSKNIFFLDMSIHIWPPKNSSDTRFEQLNEAIKIIQ